MEPLTLETIQAEIAKNPELKTVLFGALKPEYNEYLKTEGVILRSTDEEKEFLSNYEKNIIPQKVKEDIGRLHQKYEDDIFEVTGLRKGVHEKTYEFNKRLLKELKTKADKASKNGNDDPVLADRIKELEKQTKERENWVSPDEVAKIKDAHFKDGINLRIGVNLDKKAIAIPQHITEERAKQDYASMQRDMLRVNFLNKFTAKQDNEGTVVYYLGDQIQMDAHSGKPLDEGQLIDKFYGGYFVPEKKVITGSGSGKTNNLIGIDVNEASLKSKEEVINYLTSKFKAQDIKMGHPDFNKEYIRILKDYAITE